MPDSDAVNALHTVHDKGWSTTGLRTMLRDFTSQSERKNAILHSRLYEPLAMLSNGADIRPLARAIAERRGVPRQFDSACLI